MPNTAVDVNSWAVSACYPRSTFYPLSDGPSIQNHRITMTYFRTCSSCQLSQSSCACAITLTARCPTVISNLRAPPLLFGRRPPQSNYPPHTVLDPDNGPELEPQHYQAGISRLAPRKLASALQSLPAILHKYYQSSL